MIYTGQVSRGISEPLAGLIPKVRLQDAVDGVHHPVGAHEIGRPDAAAVDKQSSAETGSSTVAYVVIFPRMLYSSGAPESFDVDIFTLKRSKCLREMCLQLSTL